MKDIVLIEHYDDRFPSGTGGWCTTYWPVYLHLLSPLSTTSRMWSTRLGVLSRSSGTMSAVWSIHNYLQPPSITITIVDRECTMFMKNHLVGGSNRSGTHNYCGNVKGRTWNEYKTMLSIGADELSKCGAQKAVYKVSVCDTILLSSHFVRVRRGTRHLNPNETWRPSWSLAACSIRFEIHIYDLQNEKYGWLPLYTGKTLDPCYLEWPGAIELFERERFNLGLATAWLIVDPRITYHLRKGLLSLGITLQNR